MKKRLFSLCLLLLLVFQLCGCSSFHMASIDKLMHPPKLYGDNSELQIAFEKEVGKEVTLKAPVTGEYRSAFVFFDIDNDGSDEAFVFYVKNVAEDAVRMQVMDKAGDEWKPIMSFNGSGSEVNSVEFVDMNADSVFEIVVSWNIFESKRNKIFSVYKFNVDENIVSGTVICTEAFSVMEPIDIDTDGKMEIFFILLESTAEIPQSVARVLKMVNDDKLTLVGEVKIDANVSGYASIKNVVSKEDGLLKLYIDAYKGESQMITEVIYWNKETGILEAPLLDAETQSNMATWRSARITAVDIDNDGEIEIPAQIIMPGGVTKQNEVDTDLPFYITKWYRVKGKQLVEVGQNTINFEEGYILDFPPKWEDIITIYSNIQDKAWKVLLYDSKTSRVDGMLFTVMVVDSQMWENNDKEVYDTYFVVANNTQKNTVIAANITQAGNKLGLNKEKLKEIITAFNVE